jgi:hypothetical protein
LPSKLYAAFEILFLSVVNVAPLTVPLFPFPLSSFALPLKGHQPIKPLVGTYEGVWAIALEVMQRIIIVISVFI